MTKKVKWLLGMLVALLAAFSLLRDCGPPFGIGSEGDQAIAQAYRFHRSGVQVSGEGVVVKQLPDDNDGSRHQRFILKLGTGQTLLIAHNIDLAPRVYPLSNGDTVAFHGVYEWSKQGGVIHWTHHDPRAVHDAGWLRRSGRKFQ